MADEITIDEYKKRLLELAEKELPKETKQFLKSEAAKLRAVAVGISDGIVPRSSVPASDSHKKYHSSFEIGKTYKYGGHIAKRVYNNAPHARYVEYGRTVAKGYRRGARYGKLPQIRISKHYGVREKADSAFRNTFESDLDAWIDDVIRRGKL